MTAATNSISLPWSISLFSFFGSNYRKSVFWWTAYFGSSSEMKTEKRIVPSSFPSQSKRWSAPDAFSYQICTQVRSTIHLCSGCGRSRRPPRASQGSKAWHHTNSVITSPPFQENGTRLSCCPLPLRGAAHRIGVGSTYLDSPCPHASEQRPKLSKPERDCSNKCEPDGSLTDDAQLLILQGLLVLLCFLRGTEEEGQVFAFHMHSHLPLSPIQLKLEPEHMAALWIVMVQNKKINLIWD